MRDEDRVEQFLQAAIDRAPEPLKRLGEYLAHHLDDDEWPTAERLLLGAITQGSTKNITLPILHNWDATNVIGTLTVDPELLPTQGGDFYFAIGYRILETKNDQHTKIELTCISPQLDSNFIGQAHE